MKCLDVKSISPTSTIIQVATSVRRRICMLIVYRLACVAGGIVSARNVLAEELRSRAKNGEETL